MRSWFEEAWAKTGKKLDMGKSCVRFKKLEELPLDVIGEAIRRVPAKAYIKHIETARAAQAGQEAKRPVKKAKANASSTSATPAAKANRRAK
jgi:hypothetical protein